MGNERILVISDSHAPFHHPDAWRFLGAVKTRFQPTRVVHIGDEIDSHALSFHEHDPDLDSPSREIALARQSLLPLFSMFPDADVMESNHGSLVYRRAKASGLPATVLRSYAEVIGAPAGWKWHDELVVRLPDGSDVCFGHGKVTDSLKWSRSIAMHTVNGHFHEQFRIQYWRSPRGLFWSMVVGCLIDQKSLAFAYAKLNVMRPLLGIGLIFNSQPLLIPMTLTKAGRWNGVLP